LSSHGCLQEQNFRNPDEGETAKRRRIKLMQEFELEKYRNRGVCI